MTKHKEKSNWGRGIFLLYAMFVIFMLALVVYASFTDFQLVEKDYYQKELTYQNRIDGITNYQQTENKPAWVINQQAKIISLKFPEILLDSAITGKILFFRPSDASLDVRVNIELDPSGLQIIPISKLIKGLWIMKIEWQVSEKYYFHESDFVVKFEL